MDEVKTNLVSTVSHELKTPLSSIRMGLHLLLEERIGALNPKQLELLLAAREDSERLLRMINDLLDLARLESGQSRHRFEIVSPGTLIKNAAPDLKPLLEANDARLVTDTSAELPDVAVDLRQIGHVFSNLIANAARHSMPGEVLLCQQNQSERASGFRCSIMDPVSPENFNREFLRVSFAFQAPKARQGLDLDWRSRKRWSFRTEEASVCKVPQARGASSILIFRPSTKERRHE